MLLDKLLGLFSLDMGIDLGTANTLVCVRGEGIVLSEPSVVAVKRGTNQVLLNGNAVGIVAKEMWGKTPENIVAIRPLKDGVIADFDITEAMLGDDAVLERADGHDVLRVLPHISLATSPTALPSRRTWFVPRLTATTDGSLRTMPSPRTQTRVLAVPRSIPMSSENKPSSLSSSIFPSQNMPVRRAVARRGALSQPHQYAHERGDGDEDGTDAEHHRRQGVRPAPFAFVFDHGEKVLFRCLHLCSLSVTQFLSRSGPGTNLRAGPRSAACAP